jgi:hypothetical protein
VSVSAPINGIIAAYSFGDRRRCVAMPFRSGRHCFGPWKAALVAASADSRCARLVSRAGSFHSRSGGAGRGRPIAGVLGTSKRGHRRELTGKFAR